MEKNVCNALRAKAKTSCFARVAVLALAACAFIPVDAATLCVTRQTETSLTFTFAGFGGLDHELFVAHGATDGGEDKYAWDSFEKVADIAGDQTTYEYEVPAALRDGRPLRFFLMQTIGVNMAKEYTSIRSTGAQWIDTGVAPANNWLVDFRFKTPATFVNDTTFFGRGYSSKQYLFIFQNDNGTKFRFYGSSNYTVSTPVANTDYRLVIDPASYLTLTGGGSETRKAIDRSINGSGNFAIFGANTGARLGAFTFYRMKISANYTPTRDFVPAANAAGDIGLYDQVNNVFYKNKTETPFETGAEVPQSRFGRVMDETPTFRFPRSVSVASATADAVTLAFANPDGSAYKLYVAYGTTDCDTRKNAWTSWEEVATIAADATSYTYTLPAALKADGVYYRFFLAKTATPPYASELLSITATGAQMVRLDYVPGLDTTVDLCFGNVTYENQKVFFGQHWGGNAYLFNMQADGSNPSFRFHGGGTASTTVRPAANTDYHCFISAANKFLLNGGGASSEISEARTSYPLIDLCVFSTHRGDTYDAKFRFDSMLVKDGDVVVRDLVPVQTSAGKGALFDRASGRIFENVKGTDFTKGAVAPRQAWVVSTTESLVGSASAAPTIATLLDSITLTEDTEWSAIADRLVDAATVNLNGFELHAADYSGFLSKHPVLAGTGNLRVTVPSGTTLTINNGNKPILNGKLIKDGPGTMILSTGMTHLTGVTVAGGIMKYGTTSVFSNNGKTIEVLNGAAFDFNGNGNGNAVYYKIAGTGPDGNGALRNTGADCGNNQAQMSGLELTADALIRGTASLGIIHSGYAASTFKLNNNTLTLDLPSGKAFWICNVTTSNAGTIFVKSGQAYFHNKESKIGSVDFVIDGANAVFQKPSGGPKCTVRDIIVKNGGALNEYVNNTYIRNLHVFDGGRVPNTGIAWIYTSGTVLVSNETTDVSIYPPICDNNGSYPKLVKYGAGTLTLANNYVEERIDLGAEIFGGKVVMESVRGADAAPEKAISSQPVPVTIHAGATLDMTKCTNATPFKVTRLVVEDGGTLLHTENNNLSIAGAATYDKPLPFGAFAGSLEIAAAVTFDLTDLYSGASAPAAGADVTLFSAGTLTRTSAGIVNVVGCPYDNYVTYESGSVVLHTASAAAAELNPIKIWNVGGTYVYGANNNSYRAQLGALLAAEGWKVEMTGWRTSSASIICNAKDAWKRHAGVVDLALKTSATRAGILEGLETYCAAANYPDFTIFLCGDVDVADGVADATVLANYKAAVTRIKAALPMTTVIACTIPGGSAALTESITNWCATASDVEAVDVSELITTAQSESECAAVAAAIKAKLVTLATATGKNTPSSWTPPAVVLDATNNVPAAYLAGFTRVRTIELNQSIGFPQNVYQIPYTYAPAMQETGITNVGYYIELVRKDTGAMRALWVDMDAPGPNWADVALPVTHAQRKQMTVTKLHVWSNSGGVQQVAANDDTVEGYLEFNPVNYGTAERTDDDVIAEPWSGAYGFNDTLTTSGSSGHACFQIMRKFSEEGAFPAAEILFAFNRWGSSSGRLRGLGMGTLADYGNHGYTTSKALDWTYTYSDTASADVNNISEGAYSYIRIEFWVKYAEPSTRAGIANYLWTPATEGESTFATVGNWAKDETVATSLVNASVLLPAGASQSFTYVGWDPISLSTTTLMVDGSATFPTVGGFYLYGLDMGVTGKITFDPVKFSLRFVTPPVFAPGAKIALTPNYATTTKGRFLLMTWDRGALEMDAAALNDLFDTTSANGADVKVWAENLETGGGRLWLDLNYSAAKQRINVFCTGDSITQGSNSTYGNWRIFLMKRLAAAGYAPVAKGHWKIESNDICGAVMPEEWVWHSGISGQRLVTKGGGGTIDAIDAMLDCAGDVDFVLAKICTNDINSNGSTAEELFPVWTNLVWKTLNRKPHAKFIAGAVVDIAYTPAKDEQVVAFNAAMSNAIANATFPAKRAYFADLYTPCYRYDGEGNYITGSFYANNNLHPDWPGEDKMAETYCNAILGAIADDPGFDLGAAETGVPTTSGVENNVPAAYRAGMTRARVFDIAANSGMDLSALGYVPYAYVNDAAPTNNLSRVGYYIELKRKDTDLDDYHDLTRWIWVSIDAFGDRTITDVGIPLTTINQCVVNRLRVISNMPGIESTAADENNVRGWVEFWPSQYNVDPSGKVDAPAKVFRCDWNDKRSDNMSGYGSMQVHRFTPGAANPAQVMFAFNRWTASSSPCYEIGIGNFSHQGKSIDYTWMADETTRERMTSLAYEVAKIEIWTASDTPDGAAFVLLVEVAPSGGGEATVTGEVRDFGEGATSATLTLEWSTDPAFATVAGSTNIGVVAETGAVSATATGLTVGETWYFRFTSVNSANVSAASGVSDPLDYSEGVWRPQAATDVWTSVAWQKNGAGEHVAFTPAWTAKFDGNETTPVASVQVPEAVRTEQVTVDASANYTLTGAGAIASKRLVKKGTGTLTLGAGVLAETPDIVIEAGTVKLGDDATQGAAGRNGGTITVKNGAQFDLNYTDTTSAAGRARALVTSGKKFVIEGAGPDGDGALVSTFANTAWGSPIDEIELTGDTTIGGVSRIDIRGNTKNRIVGPTNATLTVKTRPSSDYGLGLVGGSISVGKLNVAPGGKFKIEGATAINIPYGIDLYGMFMFYTGTGTWDVGGITAMGTGGSIGNASGDAYVRTPVTIPSGAKLTMNGSKSLYYDGTVTNNGTISVSSGTHLLEGNVEAGSGAKFNVTGGTLYLSGNGDYGDGDYNVSLSGGGSLVLGRNNGGYGIPNLKKGQLAVTVASGHTGTVYFHPATSTSIDGLTCSGTVKNFFMQGPSSKTRNEGPVIAGHANDLVVSANYLEAGNGNGRGEWTVTGENSHIVATTLSANWIGSHYYAGSLTFRDGLLEVGSGGIREAWTDPARTAFNMESGTLRATANFNIGKAGMRASFGSPKKDGAVTFDLNGKTVKWGTGLTGASDVTLTGAGTFAPDRAGIQGIPLGKWTVNATGTVDLRNAAGFAGGLALAADASATLDIAGTNMVEFLAWTWTGNAWDTMKPAFQNSTPEAITPFVATSFTYANRPSSTLVDVKYGSGSGFNYIGEFYVSAEKAGTWYFSHNGISHNGLQIDDMELDRAGKNTTTTGKTIDLAEGWHKFMISFYTDAANPSFGPRSGGDTTITFKAPGDADYTVFDTTTVPMRMRQHLGARTSVRWRKYMSYGDSASVYADADESKYTTLDVVTNSLQVIHQKFSTGVNAPLGGASARFDGYFKVAPEQEGVWTFNAKFDDRIALSVDGRRLFAGNTGTASMTLRAGWHKFDIRTGDTTPSGNTTYGTGGGLTDSVGNTVALEFKVNGGAYFAFDERYLPIAYTPGDAQKFEEPGLGGVIELAAGSTLTNAPRDGGWCPIYGTLKGSGTLAGPYRFTGENNSWLVEGATVSRATLPAVQFGNATPETFKGLKSLSVTFDAQPTRRAYFLTGAIADLTAADIADVAYTVTDEAGNDYTDNLTLTVQEGRLTFTNSKPKGMFLIVR